MFVNLIFNRFFALMLFMAGIWMGSMMDPVFGLITILGGLLLGFPDSFKNGKGMDKKSKSVIFCIFYFPVSFNVLRLFGNNRLFPLILKKRMIGTFYKREDAYHPLLVVGLFQ